MTRQAIDIHTHIVPAEFPAYAGKHKDVRWPEMQAIDCGHKNVLVGGKFFRKVEDYCWDPARRLDAMAAMGITHQVLSPMPELFFYGLDAEDNLSLGRFINDRIAGMVEAEPDHLFGLGTVPMQDPEMAAREVERLMLSGKFRGVEIGTHVNGTPIGDPCFDSFYAAAEQHGAAIFIHGYHPAADRLIGPPQIAALVGFPSENAYAVASLFTSGMLHRHPRLRIACSHGGGGFAIMLKRIIHGFSIYPGVAEAIGTPPAELAQRLYYDTLVYDSDTIAFLIRVFGMTQICVASDFPFDIHDKQPLERLKPLNSQPRTRRCCSAAMQGASSASHERFVQDRIFPSSSWPGLTRPFTSFSGSV